MRFDFHNASLQDLLAYAPELRREAYVDAALQMQAEDNIAGIFGSAYSAAQSPLIDEVLIYAFGIIPVPIVGVDAFIFQHGDFPACDAIKSTMVYLTTQKCPLLYSAKMYVLDGSCPAVAAAFRSCTQKPIYVCGIEGAEDLAAVLAKVYGREFSSARYNDAQEAFTQLNELLLYLEHSELSGNDLGMLAFYSRFIFDLQERIAFLKRVCNLLGTKNKQVMQTSARIPVPVRCPDGIIQKITPPTGSYFRTVPVREHAEIACAGCMYTAAQYVAY